MDVTYTLSSRSDHTETIVQGAGMAVGKLTGPKKAAILLLALGEEGAAEVEEPRRS